MKNHPKQEEVKQPEVPILCRYLPAMCNWCKVSTGAVVLRLVTVLYLVIGYASVQICTDEKSTLESTTPRNLLFLTAPVLSVLSLLALFFCSDDNFQISSLSSHLWIPLYVVLVYFDLIFQLVIYQFLSWVFCFFWLRS